MIDLTGTLGVKADLDGSKLGARDTEVLEHLIRRYHDQRALLHRDLVFTSTLGEQLLARMFVSGQPLEPAYDAQSSTLVTYNTVLSMRPVVVEAEALCEQHQKRDTKNGPWRQAAGTAVRDPFCDTETAPTRAIAAVPGHFEHSSAISLRDWTGWLGREDSNS